MPTTPEPTRPSSCRRRSSRPSRRPSSRAAAAVAVALALGAPASAHGAPLVVEGEVPAGGPDHFFVPFEVPAGTREIEVRHDDLSTTNILDFGLDDPQGYRGWGGGTEEPSVVGEAAASRAYVPGPLPTGTWRVVVGKAKVRELPGRYRLTIELRETPTLAPDPARAPYVPRGVVRGGPAWYAGDFHVHSSESTDANVPVVELARKARAIGLDFIEISDHNTVTQLAYFGAAAREVPELLLVPGIEYTTYQGHGNAIGVERWIDHRLGQPGGPGIDDAVDAVHAAGGLFAANHPGLALGDLCIGCAFEHALSKERLKVVEVATVGQSNGGRISQRANFAYWEDLLARGYHVAAIGGSDDHGGGGEVHVGSPTTLVWARELSVPAIVDALRRGKTVVKLDGPADPMVEIVSAVPPRDDGDTVHARSTRFVVRVTGGAGQRVDVVKNGESLGEVEVTSDPFERVVDAPAPATGEDRYRAQVTVGAFVRTVTSHVFLTRDEAGPDPLAADVAAADDGGCAAARRRAGATDALLLLGALGVLVAAGRRRARP